MKLTGVLGSTLAFSSLFLSALAQRTPQSLKLEKLAKANNGLIHIDSALYDEITQNPRDYSVSIVLTAMGPQFKCQPCQIMAPEYAAVAKSWQSNKNSNSHFFASLDFEQGQAIYQKLRLQTAPTYQFFKPTVGPNASPSSAPDTFQFGQSGFSAEAIADALRKAGVPVNFKRPVDKSKLVLGALSTIFSLFGAYIIYRYATAILNPRFLWAIVTGGIIITMTSGYMWNKIRNPPYTSRMQNGQAGYIAGGYQNQVGAETHIISAVYGTLALSTYVLAHVLPQLRNQGKQRLGVYVWTGIQFVMLGTLMNIFRLKQPAYPFKFF